MEPNKPIENVIEIRCQDRFGNVIDEFKLEDPLGQDQVRIENGKLHVSSEYSKTIVLDVLPRGDKYEKKRIEFQLEDVKEDAYLVFLEPVQYKVVFRIGNTDFETTETMNPSSLKTKWTTYDYEINKASRTIYFKVHGKPVEKMSREPIHTVVERRSVFRKSKKRFPKKRRWLFLLLALLLGYGIYACVSKFVSKKTPWPFKAKSVVENEYQFEPLIYVQDEEQSEAQTQEQVTSPQDEEKPSNVAPETNNTAATVNLLQQHDINYLQREKRWDEDSLRSLDYKSLFSALKEGDVDKVIQLKESLFDSVNIQKDFQKIVDGLAKFKNADDQKKLKMSKEEMIRLCKHGTFEIGELSYSISLIDKKN